jgi:hypothetical protein
MPVMAARALPGRQTRGIIAESPSALGRADASDDAIVQNDIANGTTRLKPKSKALKTSNKLPAVLMFLCLSLACLCFLC